MSPDVSCQILEIPALGRNFELGGLYDSRNDQLLPGFSLWDRSELEARYLNVICQNRTSFVLIASDKLSEKLQKLKVNGALQLSILYGLIKLNGSASFLNEKKKTHRESSIHVRCHHGTLVKSLTMHHLGEGKITHLDVAKSGANNLATHVVTQIQYGADATFTFRKRINQSEDKQSANGMLEICGNALIQVLGRSLGGQCEGEKVDLDSGNETGIECKFEGDFKIPRDRNTPTTYEEAIQFAGQFSNFLPEWIAKDTAGGNEPLGLPCIVTLCPLVKLPGAEDAPILKHQINDIQASQCVRVMENYEEIEEKIEDLLDDPLSSIRPFRRKLEFFRDQFTSFRTDLMLKLKDVVVKIRSGEHDVSFLGQFLDRIGDEQFVFHPNRIESWLEEKHEELCMVKRFKNILTTQLGVDNKDRILIFPTEKEIREHMTAASIRHAVHFVLTSMASPESFLQLSKTTRLDLSDNAGNSPTVDKDQQWHMDNNVLLHIEDEISDYVEFIKANIDDQRIVFAMKVLEDHDKECTSGSSVFVYENGIMVRKNYELPGIPRSVNIEWDDDSNQLITFLAPAKGEILQYRINRTENLKHVSSVAKKPVFVLPIKNALAMIDCGQMEITVTAECLYGKGPPYKASILETYMGTPLEWLANQELN
ncbi:LOW QUALITY PROTEIN: neoverrucotoxin subunit alpha-like [Daphnia carinata]|uniref:LOW QUALITY PROTEIN: neoverrucotoxin subunit alpha-like n=1 Tax=Daphnia carinata TaxID=120202 RepID=UPI00257E4BC1|nr:LOW QUALITY PROTEIN: neoverrucotoxin subunit alpha-like [Daphnia carinata]